MRLRNKKTGEIVNLTFLEIPKHMGQSIYNSLVELNEEWEDAEPKEYWYVDDAGVEQIDQVLSSVINMRKSIGNYFSSREEAELAVRKLNAWQRLKDKGFRFSGVDWMHNSIRYDVDVLTGQIICNPAKAELEETKEDLILLFGGEQ